MTDAFVAEIIDRSGVKDGEFADKKRLVLTFEGFSPQADADEDVIPMIRSAVEFLCPTRLQIKNIRRIVP